MCSEADADFSAAGTLKAATVLRVLASAGFYWALLGLGQLEGIIPCGLKEKFPHLKLHAEWTLLCVFVFIVILSNTPTLNRKEVRYSLLW